MYTFRHAQRTSQKNMQLDIYKDFIPIPIISELIENKNNFLIEPFLDPKWIDIWWKNIGKNEYDTIEYLIFKKNNSVVLILPLVRRKLFFINIVEIAGGKVSDYLTPIFSKIIILEDKDLLFIKKKLINHFNKCDIFFFRKQKKYHNLKNPLLNIHKPILAIHKSFNIQLESVFYNKRIKKITNDNRRQLKRLDNFGDTKFVYSETKLEKKKILNSMILQKEQRYKDTKVWNMFEKKYYKDFYNELIDTKFNFLKLHISALKIKNNYCSTHFGFYNERNFYYLMPSFDNKNFGVYSVGNILLENLINFTKSKNLKVFDFTIGNEDYKKKWSNQTEDLFEVILSNSIKGYFGKLLILLAFFLKKISFIDNIYKKLYKKLHT